MVSSIQNLEDDFQKSVDRILDTFISQRTAALRSMKKMFTGEELTGLCDMYNGTYFETYWMYDKGALIAELTDSDKLENVSGRFGFDFGILVKKLEGLSELQVFYLNLEIYRFWNVEKAYGSPSPNLEMFIKLFT